MKSYYYLGWLLFSVFIYFSCSGGEVTCKTDSDCDGMQICSDGLCTPPECSPKKPCSDGKICVKNRCQNCERDGDCGDGKICEKGACRNGCRRDGDCKAPLRCEVKSLTCVQCLEYKDCEGGLVCDDKEWKCRPCQKDEECLKDHLCIGGKCTPGECRRNSDCSQGQVCRELKCMPCSDDGDCEMKGEICDKGVCRYGCRDDADCKGGGSKNLYCDKVLGVCVGCTSNGHCQEGLVCRKNSCRPCTATRECDRGNLCINGRCRPGECTRGEDCPQGKGCRDFFCKDCKSNSECRKGQLCVSGRCYSPPKFWTAEGKSKACNSLGAGKYQTIPDMQLNFELKEESVVLILFDMNVGGCDDCRVAVRLKVDSSIDPNWTSVRPMGADGEVEHMHLFRIERLSAGQHTVEAQWGGGIEINGKVGQMCNDLSDKTLQGRHWIRKLSVLAFPLSSGVKWGYVVGKRDACLFGSSAQNSFKTVPELELRFELAEDSVVLSLGMLNWYRKNSFQSWGAFRLTVDGNSDARATSTQPLDSVKRPPRVSPESDQLSLHRIELLKKGKHRLEAEWGLGSGEMCNDAGSIDKIWTRRLGFIAIPKKVGVQYFYREGTSDIYEQSSTIGAFKKISDMNATLNIGRKSVVLSSFDMNYFAREKGQAPWELWGGVAIGVDGKPSFHFTHSKSNFDSEDTHLHLHRLDSLSAGSHSFEAYWVTGKGYLYNKAGKLPFATRRLGILAIPIE